MGAGANAEVDLARLLHDRVEALRDQQPHAAEAITGVLSHAVTAVRRRTAATGRGP